MRRFFTMLAAAVVLLQPAGGLVASAAPSKTQSLGLTVWSVPGVSALDAVGSIVAVARVPAPVPGQAVDNAWSLAHAFYFVGDSRAFGVVSLDSAGGKRYASIALSSGSTWVTARRVEFSWAANQAYLPLAVVSAGSLTGHVYDYTRATWTNVGSIPLPSTYGRLSPVSTTYLGWHGMAEPDCASYPGIDHYRYTPLGVINGNPQALPSTPIAEKTTAADCPVTVNAQPTPSWRRFQAGSAQAPVVQWAGPNHDDANTRESTLSPINSRTIGQLRQAWRVPVTGIGVFGAMAGMNPVVVDGSAYVQDLQSNVYAVDATTGALKWKRSFNAENIGPNGPAVDEGRVYVTTSMSTVAALDAVTGGQLWSWTIPNAGTQGITTQMAASGGVLYFSTVPAPTVEELYPPGGMGILYALDGRTGTPKWSFNTVKDGDLWGHPEINSGGGAWYPPAIDRTTGTTYWGIGNPAPFPGTTEYPNGSSRPGPNLYTNSMLAVDHAGNLKWYHQVTPHDLFDYDFEAPPILTTTTLGGVDRKLVLGAGKAGRVLAFDADTGAVIWDVKVGVHENSDLTSLPLDEEVVVRPGFVGGVMSPMALSEGLLFVPVSNTSSLYTATSDTAPVGATGEFLALDVRTGATVWKVDLAYPVYAGATVVRDVVVTATLDGTVLGFERTTGKRVWSSRAAAGINAPLAISGDALLVPVGFGNTPSLVGLRLTTP